MLRSVFQLFLAAVSFGLSSSQSISSCGSPGDHLKNVQITLSPDPIVKNQPFQVTVTGDMDQDHVGGIVTGQIDVKALRIIDKSIPIQSNYSISPGFGKGLQRIVIGPVNMPSNLPGSAELVGKINVQNSLAEPVACIKLNLFVPAQAKEGTFTLESPLVEPDCKTPTDHLKNIHSSKEGDTTTVTATLDEDIGTATANIDVSLHALFVNIPVKMSIPFSFSSSSQPGFRKGDWKAVAHSPPAGERLGATVKGTISLLDAANTQVTCTVVDAILDEEQSLVV